MLMVAMIAPWLGVLLVLASPRSQPRLAYASSALASLIALLAWAGVLFSETPPPAVDLTWIDGLGLRFALQVDGLALVHLLGCALLFPVALVVNWRDPERRRRSVPALALVFEGVLFVAFAARDPLLHWVAQDLAAFIIFVAIVLGGGRARREAGISFIIHAVIGSLPLLIALLALRARHGDLASPLDPEAREALAGALAIEPSAQWLGAVAFLVAAATRLGLPPLRGWLRDLEAAPAGLRSLLLAGWFILGSYPLLRFAHPLFADAFSSGRTVLSVWALGAAVLAALRWRRAAGTARRHSEALAFGVGLAAFGLVQDDPFALAGATLLVFAFAVSVLLRILVEDDARPIVRRLGFAADLGVGLAPGFLGFAAWLAILRGSFDDGPLAALVFAAVSFLGVSVVVRRGAASGYARRATGLELSAAFLLLILLLAGGLAVGPIIETMAVRAEGVR